MSDNGEKKNPPKKEKKGKGNDKKTVSFQNEEMKEEAKNLD